MIHIYTTEQYNYLLEHLGAILSERRGQAREFIIQTHWLIGDEIRQVFGEKKRCGYGESIISQLAENLKINESYLYESWEFRDTFPTWESFLEFEQKGGVYLTWTKIRDRLGIQRKPEACNHEWYCKCVKCGKERGKK